MKIRMLSSRHGSVDGQTIKLYEEGSEYEMSASPTETWLGGVFVNEGWAETVAPVVSDAPAAPDAPVEAVETVASEPAPAAAPDAPEPAPAPAPESPEPVRKRPSRAKS